VRARATVDARRPSRAPQARSARERELVDRYAEAFEAADVDRLVALLTDDALMTMPPQPIEVHGPEAIARFFRERDWWGVAEVRLVPTRANDQPAFGLYLRDPHAPLARAHSLVVLTLDADGIAAITRFEPSLLARFGLPRTLDLE
jgi:RNA polymerase sigma-70 factor (ECF subfamily)